MSGINADAIAGLVAKDDGVLLRTIDELDLEKWPSWYAAQYDALVVQPRLRVDALNSDENQPARIWREGKAKVAGKLRLYPKDEPGQRVSKPKKTARRGILVGLEPWIGGWQPAPGSEMLYPPACVRSAQGLPGVLAGNPGLPQTLPFLFVTEYPGKNEYAYVPLAHRVDIDRLYGLCVMSPEWTSVSPHGSHGSRYK